MTTRPVRRAHQGLALLAAGALLFSCTWGERSGGDKKPYTIGGTVTHAGAGLEGVTVLFQGAGAPPAVVTGADGSYEQTDFPAGNFTVVPSHGDYEFRPPSATVDASTDPTVNFEAVPAGAELALWSPNGGEFLVAGTTARITWNSTGPAGSTVQLDYWDDSVAQWVNIAGGVANADGKNAYDWPIPIEAADPGPVRLRVISEEYPALLRDESAGGFTIAGIQVTSPNGGETWYYEGEDELVTWIAPGVPGDVEIGYSTDGGTTYPGLIATVPASDGSYAWTIPNEASAQCSVRVRYTGGAPADGSDADFAIAPATMAIISPAGGESWATGSSQTISWTAAGPANVRVELSRDGGGSWVDIVASTPAAAGSYAWTPTGPASPSCVVRISDASDGVPAAASPAFTILEPIMLAIAPDTASEGAGVLAGAAVASVPTPVAADLVVGLSSDDASELTVPASVTILSGASSAVFDLTVVDDALIDWDRLVTVAATAAGYAAGSDSLTIQDDESRTLAVAVPAEATEGDGVLVGAGTVSVPANVETGLIVSLSSDDATEATAPASVTISAGTSSVTFDLTVADDAVLDFDQVATVTASAPGFTDGTDAMTVHDDEPAVLTVTITPDTATEGAGVLAGAGTVSVPANVESALTVTLSSDDTSEATVPPTVVIGTGTSSAAFDLTVEDDAVIDFDQVVMIAATAAGFTDGSDTITVQDNESAVLTVAVPSEATEADGALVGGGTVSVPANVEADLMVSLSSDDTSEATVPASVVIAAGTNAVLFDLTVEDDAVLDLDQAATITASAAGFTDGTDVMTVHDNEPAVLTVSVPVQATEGNGVLTDAGTVSVPANVETDLTVNLSSDDTTEATVPVTVVISAGTSSATFDVTVVDDGIIDGNKVVTITATATGYTLGSDTITIQDNENTVLSVDVPATAAEDAGVLTAAGTVSVSGTVETDLTVLLSSTDTTEATVPASVVISAGTSFVTFNVTVVDDAFLDGSETVTIIATATGYVFDSDAMTVQDDESAVLTVDVPATATEGDGVLPGAGTVSAPPKTVTTTCAVSQDVFLEGVAPDTNRNGHNYGLHTDSFAAEEAQSLVQFDLSGIPGGATITNATMKLACWREQGGGATDTVQVIRCDSSWVETSATWNSDSGNGSVVATTFLVGDWGYNVLTPPYTLHVDITGLVQDWVDGVYSNYGVRLFPNDGMLDARWVNKEDTCVQGAQYVPALQVTYAEDFTVDLSSDDVSEATVPVSVVILAGLSSATFDVTVENDALPDGAQLVTITASAAGYTDGTDTILVQDDEPAAVTQFVIIDPADGTVGAPVTVTVQAQDQFDQVVTTYAQDVTLVADSGTVTFTGGALVDIVNGVGTKDISDTVAETVILSLSDTEATFLNVDSTQDVVFALGAPTKFVILNPSDGTVDAAITVTVQAQDQFDQVVTTYDQDVTLVADSGTVTFTGGALVDIVNGVGTKDISDTVAETVILSLTDSESTGLEVDSTQDVLFALGAPTQFVILDPLDGTVDNPVTVTVQAQDQFGQVVTTYETDVTLDTTGAATGGGVVNIVSGVGSLDISDTVAETVTLTLADSQGTGLNVSSTQDVIFGPGAATKLVFTVQPTDAVAGVAISPSIVVTAYDSLDNVDTTYVAAVTLADTFAAVTLGGIPTQPAVAGVATFADITIDTTGTYTLDATSGVLPTETSASFNITPATATKLVFTAQPTDAVAGVAISPSIVVTAYDAFDNVDTSYVAAVTLSDTAAVVALGGAPTQPAVAGVATFADITIDTTGTYTLDATSGVLPAETSASFNITPDVATEVLTTDPGDDFAAGGSTVLTAEVQDQYGNTVTTDNSTQVTFAPTNSGTVLGVTMGTGDGSYGVVGGAETVTVSGGVATITLTDTVAETFEVAITNNAGLTNPANDSITVSAAPATQFVILDPTDGTVDAAITVTVQAQDQYGNVVTTYGWGVMLVTSGSATGGGLVPIVDGVGSLDISDTVAETVTLSLTDTEGTLLDVTSTQDVLFAAGAATQFVILGPTDGTVDAAITVTVQAQDQFGQVVTTYETDVTLDTTGSATGGGVVDIVSGEGTLDISDTVAETVTLSLTDSSATGLDVTSTQDVIFGPGAAAQLAFTVEPGGTVADGAITPAVEVTVQDQYGNTVTTATDSIAVAIGNNPGAGTLSGTTTVAAAAGVATFSDLSIDEVGSGYTLTASSGILAGATSAAFDITP